MTVKELLPKLKANKHTYYNISKNDIKSFQDKYKYLKKNCDKTINFIAEIEIEKWFSNKEKYFYNLDYLNKYKIMAIISKNIK